MNTNTTNYKAKHIDFCTPDSTKVGRLGSMELSGLTFNKGEHYPFFFNSHHAAMPYTIYNKDGYIFMTIEDFLKYFKLSK